MNKNQLIQELQELLNELYEPTFKKPEDMKKGGLRK